MGQSLSSQSSQEATQETNELFDFLNTHVFLQDRITVMHGDTKILVDLIDMAVKFNTDRNHTMSFGRLISCDIDPKIYNAMMLPYGRKRVEIEIIDTGSCVFTIDFIKKTMKFTMKFNYEHYYYNSKETFSIK